MALNIDPNKTSAPLRATSPTSSSGRRVDLRSLHALMSNDAENAAPEAAARQSKGDKRRTWAGESSGKSAAAPAFLNTSFNGEKVRMAAPSVLQPSKQQAQSQHQQNSRDSSAATQNSGMTAGPARLNLQALIAKYDKK